MFMEMNFPHKSALLEADREAAGEILQRDDYNALLAHAIARQSLSLSARAVVNHRMKLATAIASNRGRSFENRIRFFAGQVDNPADVAGKATPFVRGHFHPDIADQFIVGEGA